MTKEKTDALESLRKKFLIKQKNDEDKRFSNGLHPTEYISFDGDTIPSQTITLTSCNIIDVEAGSNGYKGGDGGHGGIGFVQFNNAAGTAWKVRVKTNEHEYFIPYPNDITIEVYGDTEISTFSAALQWSGEKIAYDAENK